MGPPSFERRTPSVEPQPSYFQEGPERARRVHDLFAKIARRYDLINDLQSLYLHRTWKSQLISSLQLNPGDRLLDLACGSGDLVFRALKSQPSLQVIGGDFTFPMLQVARSREHEKPNSQFPIPNSIHFLNLDALSLPFHSSTFNAVTIGYGLRNFSNLTQALSEISRLLKPGGNLAILDFGKPKNLIVRAADRLILQTLQPLLGWIFFRDSQTYRYIQESLDHYPGPEGVTRLLQESGFSQISCRSLALGIMTLHTAKKPSFLPSKKHSMSLIT